MKKIMLLCVVFVLLVFTSGALAQDYQATAQALEAQLQIMQLQATIQALQGAGGSGAPSGQSGNGQDMWDWGQQNSPLYATPTPFNYQPPASNPITQYNFPAQARPLTPSGPPPVWKKPSSHYLTEITVGAGGQFRTLNEAVKKIPGKAGEVVIYLMSNTEEPQEGVSVPIDRGITSLRITSNNDQRRVVYPADRSVWFFCNGIPLIIDRTVEFSSSTMIMGGLVTYSGHNVQAPNSTIIVNGKAYWVYAGGQSDREGHSSTVDSALVIVNGEVDRVYAGGRSIWGETIVHNATVVVNGTAKEVYCAGFTQNTTAKATVGRADMRIYGWYQIFGLGLGSGENVLLSPYGCYQ